MKMLPIAITAVFIYGASVAQGTSFYVPTATDDPPTYHEMKKEQNPELGDLKGPRAKNYPEYKYKSTKVAVESTKANEARRIGPKAKNSQAWDRTDSAQHLVVTQKKKKHLKGPRAKNQKPWNN